jgi:uncharacterized protein YbaA (DUF1428 family)
MTYVDGFVLPVPENALDEYTKLAERAGPVFMEHGALAYKECVLDDDNADAGTRSFRDAAGVKPGQTVVFAFILYRDRAQRDEVNRKVFHDERMKDMHDTESFPFDMAQMAWGGFAPLVDL